MSVSDRLSGPCLRRERPGLTGGVAAVAALALLLAIPAFAPAGSHSLVASSSQSSSPPATAAARLPGPGDSGVAPAPARSAAASVPRPALSTGGTIIVANATIVPGNSHPWNLAVPLGISYDSANQSVWITGAYSGNLGRYDPDTGTLWAGSPTLAVATYPTGFGGGATAIAPAPDLGELFVASPAQSSVVVVNDVTGAPEATIPLGSSAVPTALAYDPQDLLAFVADQRQNRVWVINASSDMVASNVTVGTQPDGLWWDAQTDELYVANYASSNVSVVNVSAPSVITALRVGAGPVGFAQVGTTVWVLNQQNSNVSFINDQTRAVTGSAGVSASASIGLANSLVYDSGLHQVFVLNAGNGDIQVLNSTTGGGEGFIVDSGVPYRGVYDPVHGEIDVVNTAHNSLDVISDGSQAWVRSTVLGSAPMASYFDPLTQIVYVADASVSWLEEFNAVTNARVATVPLPAPGIDLTYSSQASILAIVMSNGGVDFFSPASNSIQGSWKLTNGTMLLHGAYGNGEFFFTGGLPYASAPFHNVFIVGASGFAQITCVGAGVYDSGVAYDTVNHYVYVATNVSLLIVSSVSDDRVGSIAVPGAVGLEGLAYSQRSNALVVGDAATGVVSVYNLSLAAFDSSPFTIPGAGSVVYSSDTNTFYVASTSGSTVSTLVDHGGSSYTTGVINVGIGPSFAAYSSLSGLLYVSNAASGTISLIQAGSSASLPMIVSITISPTTVALGSNVFVSAIATYPMWNDTFSYAGLPTGCPSRNSSAFVCTPNETGSFQATVTATNPLGASASNSARFAVFSPLTVLSFTAQPAEFTLGYSTQVMVTVGGGVAPVTVGYPSRPTGCAATNSTNWTCKPTAAGNFTLETTVTDYAGHTVSANLSLIVNPHLTITSFTPSVTSILAGNPMNFAVVIAGGTAPFTYSYTGLPPGCVGLNASTVPCVPTAAAVYPVLVKVTDIDGATAQANTTLVVSAPPGQNGQNGLSTTDLLIIVAIVVIAAVGAAVALAFRRRGGGTAPPAAARSRPARPETPPEEEAPEEESMIVEAPPPEPLLPPTPPPVAAPAERPPPPRFHTDPNAPRAPPPRPAAPAPGTARPPLVCSYCGTSNEPWLTVCRKCKRALMTTGTS